MKEITIYQFQLENIIEALRLASNIHGSQKGETCFDRQVRDAYLYGKNEKKKKKDAKVRFGKNI